MKILVIEDDQKIAKFLQKGLKEAGYSVDHMSDGEEGLIASTGSVHYDIIILDLMLPKLDGMSVLESLRSKGIQTPVLILSAKQSVDDRVKGLQLGGDDYLVKPFSFSELLARVEVLLRRSGSRTEAPKTTLQHFGITMDLIKRKVTREHQEIELQAKEFTLLEYFMRNPDKAISKTLILEQVYGYNFDTQTNVVDVLVFRLRDKIDKGFTLKTIHTIRGVGYVFKVE